jgi:predicted AlkP superfamily phosphohydrolase/phosphomutase
LSGGEERVRRWTVGRGWVSLMSGMAVVEPGRTRTQTRVESSWGRFTAKVQRSAREGE